MNFKQKIEKLLPAEDQLKWLEGVRYRVEQLQKAAWDRLQVLESENQINAKSVFVFEGDAVNLIQTNIPFLSIKDSIDHFRDAKNKNQKRKWFNY